jgi:NADPH2:quinone reductase
VSQAIRISEYGGPDVLRLVDVEVGEPGPDQVRVRHHACGINFIDVYQRTGLYANPLPLTPGGEGAGVVEAVGANVSHLAVGDRVAYAAPKPGSYSQQRVLDALHVCRLPDEIDFETGAAMMLKGLTVNYLLRRTLPVEGLAPAVWA